MQKIIYFARHAQSADNVLPVFQSPESPLNETGKQQAEKVADRLSRRAVEALIASPFRRAKETAEAIERATGTTLEFSDLFVERVKPTSINGKPYTDKKAAATWGQWEKSLYTPGMRVEDGENFDDLVSRADRALAYLRDRRENVLAVVTHGYFFRTILARVLLGDLLSGEALRHVQQAAAMENTGLSVLRHHGGGEGEASWHLWVYNDHAHLE